MHKSKTAKPARPAKGKRGAPVVATVSKRKIVKAPGAMPVVEDMTEEMIAPMEIEGGRARKRLDRPSPKGYKAGGAVSFGGTSKAPHASSPSLEFTNRTGIGLDDYRGMSPREISAARMAAGLPERETDEDMRASTKRPNISGMVSNLTDAALQGRKGGGRVCGSNAKSRR